MGDAWIDGRPVARDAAFAEAARLLRASRLPVFAGLGTDVGGTRAAIALAERLGGVVDHMSSDALLRDVDVVREAGMMTTTRSEARLRADVVLMVGPAAVGAWQQLSPAPDAFDRRLVRLCPGSERGPADGASETIGRDPQELPALLAALRACVAGRPFGTPGVPATAIGALGAQLQRARFGLAIWSAAELDALAIEMLCGLVKDLNAKTRFSGLPLPPGDNAIGVLQTCGWMTGFPMRTGFGRGFPEHDPWRFDARRLVESGEADCVLWISAYRAAMPPWQRDLPTIALTAAGASGRRRPRVHVAVGRPGIDHDSIEHVWAVDALAWVEAAAKRETIGVAEAIAGIAAALPDAEARPC